MPSSSFSLGLFATAAVIAVIGQALVLRDGLAGRTPAASQSTAGRAREALWIVIPAIALALTLAATWRALPRQGRSVTPATQESASPAASVTSRHVAPAGG